MHNLTSSLLLTVFVAAVAILLSQIPIKAQESPSKTPRLLKIPPSGYKAAPETAESKEGAEIFKSLNCMACHSVRNVGGSLGPLLDAIGSKRSESFLIAHLSKAQEQEFSNFVGTEKRSHNMSIRISDKSARLIAKYLLTLEEPPGGFLVVPHKTRLPAAESTSNQAFKPTQPTESSQQGEEIFSSKGCIACHSIGDFGGWLGPKLDGVGGRLSKSVIASYVTDAQAYALSTRPDADEYPSEMPKLDLSADDIQKIVDYLLTLPASKEDSGARRLHM